MKRRMFKRKMIHDGCSRKFRGFECIEDLFFLLEIQDVNIIVPKLLVVN